jgi:peroxiredoxin (alkyl hydroperoxide reductase subunit C)
VLTGDGAVAYRGLFLIDKDGIVRHQIVNDLPLGRNVDEALRMVDALQLPRGARRGLPGQLVRRASPGMKGSAEGVASYLKENAKGSEL